jgi:GNAT superfamily N-acetyltransferase
MHSSQLTIRAAQASNVPHILAMIHEMAEFEHLTHLLNASEEQLENDLFGPRPAAECVVATVDAQPVGYALFFHNYSTFLTRKGLYLEDLYVKADARSLGVGKALLKHLAKLACERQCARFEWSVLDWNTAAIQFYEKLGASVLPDWRTCRVTGDALQAMAQDGS